MRKGIHALVPALAISSGAIALVIDPAGHAIGMYSRTPLPPEPPKAK